MWGYCGASRLPPTRALFLTGRLMGKLFFLIASGFVVYYLLRSSARRHGSQAPETPPAEDHGKTDASPGGPEDMVRCTVCGVYQPRSESVVTQGQFFCSLEHQRQKSPKGH